MRVARSETGRWILIGLLALIATALLAIWWNDYVIDMFGHTAEARVGLRAMANDATEGIGLVIGTVEPGARCYLLKVKVKVLAAFRIKCSDGLEGWTDEAQAFDPPLRVSLFGR